MEASQPGGEAAPEADSGTVLSDADALDALGDEIATLTAHVHAATHRLLMLIGEFDRRGGWRASGQKSCAHWLALRTGIDLGTAQQKVAVARALTELPQTSAAWDVGSCLSAR